MMMNSMSLFFLLAVVLMSSIARADNNSHSTRSFRGPGPTAPHVQAEQQQQQQHPAQAHSENIRNALKTAFADDEDVIVMQTELAWGAAEMQKYKNLRGEFPIRKESKEQAEEHGGIFRELDEFSAMYHHHGNGQSDYWNYLVSLF
jgi:hypothetical protein